MAANKFATVLSRNTNKITVILVYAVLEWLFIFFLFLHSLYTFLLVKFASYFGLKQLCLFCLRLDRVFERNPETGFTCKELLCENHAAEFSNLSFCKNHRKVAESMKMCPDCSDRDEDKTLQRSVGVAFCACCQKSLEEKTYPNYLLIKSSSWGDSLGYKENGGLILEMIDDDKIGDGFEKERESDRSEGKLQEQNNGEVISDVESYGLSLREVSEEDGLRSISTNFLGNEDEISEIQHFSRQLLLAKDDYSAKIIDLSDHEILACDPGRLIPVELIDSSTINNHEVLSLSEENLAPEAEQKDDARDVPTDTDGPHRNPGQEEEEEEEEEEETEGADLLDEQSETKKLVSFSPLLTVRENGEVTDANDDKEDEEEEEEDEKTEEQIEEKLPETPTSAYTLNSLHKKLLLLDDRREPSAEESVDESVASDMDSGDPFQTIEKLRTAVKVERETLRVLYAELEEERSASAIAANQTMAMITRLQEEKAKVQMEALQYQRMMEEQAEYDQEALQLLNDLMVKREKEKEEIQKELEVYRKKVLEYEAKEKKKTVSKNGEGEESASDDADDRNEYNEDQDDSSETDVDLEKITMDCVKHMSMLDESLSEFEEERLAILDQLKVLEEKLVTMQEDESAEETSKFEGNETSMVFSERLTMASMAKSLLPLLDAAENEREDGFDEEERESVERNDSVDGEKLEIIKKVDNVYERLQALETDGEFLKNCMSSVKKGDKGMGLLQEILQHLRDLRNIELNET